MTKKAVILLSGGLDSATVGLIAKSQQFDLYALSINYQQRHSSELDAARRIAQFLDVKRHEILHINLAQFGGSALTDTNLAVPTAGESISDIPITYVPARNTIMLSLALAFAETIESKDIFFGANAVDYSGYPDCRPAYIQAFEKMANLATKMTVQGQHLTIHTPIIANSKAQIIQKGLALGMDYSLTVSCYQANEQGLACGICDSCQIRKQGFKEANITDPTRYASKTSLHYN